MWYCHVPVMNIKLKWIFYLRSTGPVILETFDRTMWISFDFRVLFNRFCFFLLIYTFSFDAHTAQIQLNKSKMRRFNATVNIFRLCSCSDWVCVYSTVHDGNPYLFAIFSYIFFSFVSAVYLRCISLWLWLVLTEMCYESAIVVQYQRRHFSTYFFVLVIFRFFFLSHLSQTKVWWTIENV